MKYTSGRRKKALSETVINPQTFVTYEKIYYTLWELSQRYQEFCQFRVIGSSHDERMIPMLEVGKGSEVIFCVTGLDGTQKLLPGLLLKMVQEYCIAYECRWQLEDFYDGAQDADFLVYNTTIDRQVQTLEDLLKKCSLLKDFKAVKNHQVWCTTEDMYQQSMSAGNLIEDFHRMLTGDDKETRYLYRLK